jgi:hypothetical protein
MGRDAHSASRRVGDRMVRDEVRFLTAKAAQLLAEFDRAIAPAPDRRMQTFEDVERIWTEVVWPVFPSFACLEGYVQPTAEVEALPDDSVWKRNSRGKLPK